MPFVPAFADVPLIGSQIPDVSLLDGDFEELKAGWRTPKQSPYWITEVVRGGGRVGVAEGKMMNNGATLATVESVPLENAALDSLRAGDVLAWRFASNTEYPCDGRVSFALVFADVERMLVSRVEVPSCPEPPRVYEGFYTVTEADVRLGQLSAKFHLETTHGIKVYIDWVDLRLLRQQSSGPAALAANVSEGGVELTWYGEPGLRYAVYRSHSERGGYERVATDVVGNSWIDTSTINGKTYFYVVKPLGENHVSSKVVSIQKLDSVAPAAPQDLVATGKDWVVQLAWTTQERDIEYYKVYRSDDGGENFACIAPYVTGLKFEDMLPIKSAQNSYAVRAVDYSGNESELSAQSMASVQAVRGASFSDLILPMPIHKELRSDLWGAAGVLPRDPDNGVEHPDWSYWGGKIIQSTEDGTYHMQVVRWLEGDRRGHWAWPHSTVAHVVSDYPTGPYRVVKDLAYDYQGGLGHNTNIIPLNDGSYAMYSLINWKSMMLHSDSLNGPWEVLGEIQVNVPKNYKNPYRLERNLSGVHCEDGSFLIVTKAGAMMRSENGILGPYEVVSETTDTNQTIPERYRHSNYEDPTLWYDGVQYHKIINAFLDYRAIYLRSPDGIHWKYEDGLAYTPTCTVYEDGTRTFWYKVERPNVLQDAYGRATHLSLAAVDVKKDDDYGNDNHSSKHLVIPLVVHKRVSMLNTEPVSSTTDRIRILIHSELGFDATQDIDLESLRFGAAEVVNFGGGSKVLSTEEHSQGLIVEFDGEGNGIKAENFVAKLIGRTKDAELIVAFSKLQFN
ncbi:MAG: hypothetical protein ACON4O_04105 [Lentimonas sp.]